MSRLLDISPDEESEVVNRVVMQIHRAIDENFGGRHSNLSKTVFHPEEDTKVERPSNNSQAGEEATVELSESRSQKTSAPAKPPTSDQGNLEYSRMDQFPTGKPSLDTGQRLLLVAAAGILLMVLTAYMVYQLLDP